MQIIQRLPTHVANLIAAGEVVERPASAVKELMENAVDAGASKVTVEIRDGGMTFLRVTDNGCGMSPEDAPTAFLRHATSKLHTEQELASIATMGFRGEALAAIASVSRIDLLTKTRGAVSGTQLHLEGGKIMSHSEAGCPDGTTIIVRDLFFNTPARMKFMKSDSVEGSRVSAVVQLQALAHPEVAVTFLRDGTQVLSTPGSGDLEAAMYCVYGRGSAAMARVDSAWESYRVSGFISKPTDARPSRSLQTFFVNDRPVRSKILTTALEEAYRNQLMVGKFPSCVLHLHLPNEAVDVNVHPAKTEVKFLNEKNVFDCVHYGCLAALNRTPDRPTVQLPGSEKHVSPAPQPAVQAQQAGHTQAARPKQDFYQTMTPQEYKRFAGVVASAPRPQKEAAQAALNAFPSGGNLALHEDVMLPTRCDAPKASAQPAPTPPPVAEVPVASDVVSDPEPEQQSLPMPTPAPWRMVGELYRTYIIVEQGDDAFLIDKHAAHERILFDKLKANPNPIGAQMLLTPLTVQLSASGVGEVLNHREELLSLGFDVEEFGENTVLLRQIPMELNEESAPQTLIALADNLLSGRHERPENVRDEMLHTVACKAAIKAGWVNDEKELLAIVREVMGREDLKYCPHGRPICVSLSKKTLEKQFRRT